LKACGSKYYAACIVPVRHTAAAGYSLRSNRGEGEMKVGNSWNLPKFNKARKVLVVKNTEAANTKTTIYTVVFTPLQIQTTH